MPELIDPIARRFFAKVQFAEKWYDDGTTRTRCLEWTASKFRAGYGQFKLNGTMIVAHRWLYERWVGPIPEGLQCDHLCRNTSCVNPQHIEVVTPRVNVLRSTNPLASNAKKTHCLRGHELTTDNTYWFRAGRSRSCRACMKIRDAKTKAKNREHRD